MNYAKIAYLKTGELEKNLMALNDKIEQSAIKNLVQTQNDVLLTSQSNTMNFLFSNDKLSEVVVELDIFCDKACSVEISLDGVFVAEKSTTEKGTLTHCQTFKNCFKGTHELTLNFELTETTTVNACSLKLQGVGVSDLVLGKLKYSHEKYLTILNDELSVFSPLNTQIANHVFSDTVSDCEFATMNNEEYLLFVQNGKLYCRDLSDDSDDYVCSSVTAFSALEKGDSLDIFAVVLNKLYVFEYSNGERRMYLAQNLPASKVEKVFCCKNETDEFVVVQMQRETYVLKYENQNGYVRLCALPFDNVIGAVATETEIVLALHDGDLLQKATVSLSTFDHEIVNVMFSNNVCMVDANNYFYSQGNLKKQYTLEGGH